MCIRDRSSCGRAAFVGERYPNGCAACKFGWLRETDRPMAREMMSRFFMILDPGLVCGFPAGCSNHAPPLDKCRNALEGCYLVAENRQLCQCRKGFSASVKITTPLSG